MAKAIYAFSGDPITYGHIDIIERAAQLFGEVVVGIGANPEKKHVFSLDERLDMASRSLQHLGNIKVVPIEGMLTDYAYTNGISIIVRGVRDVKDYEYESMLYHVADSQKMGVEFLLLPAKKNLAHVSSTVAKALQKEQGLVHEYVPLYVKQRLEEKISGQYLLGITGEMGAGKSYMGERLREHCESIGISAHHVELDHLGHRILSTVEGGIYSSLRERIVKVFGNEVLGSKGIDRKALSEIVFNNEQKRLQLNSLMAQPLFHALRKEICNKDGLILVNAALFAEFNLMHLCNNNMLLVTADKESQERRLQRRGLTKEQIPLRLKTQYSSAEKKRTIEDAIQKDRTGKLWVIENSDGTSVFSDGPLFKLWKSEECASSFSYSQVFDDILDYFHLKSNKKEKTAPSMAILGSDGISIDKLRNRQVASIELANLCALWAVHDGLRTRAKLLFQTLGIDPDAEDESECTYIENIYWKYGSLFQRYYHDLSHLTDCFSEFDNISHFLENPEAVEFAILWHDF